MERRFAVRYKELMAEAEVRPEDLEGVLGRLDDFVQPFAASLGHDAQRQHAAEYVAGLVSNVKRKWAAPTMANPQKSYCFIRFRTGERL
jgi:hypothetical protein